MSKRILIIDDEAAIQQSMRLVLEVEGHAVTTFGYPPSLDEIVALQPHIIFLDLLLKGANGKEFCAELKKHLQTKDIPIIMLSAHTSQMLEDAVAVCGANGYLSKPFDINTLYGLVAEHASGSEAPSREEVQ